MLSGQDLLTAVVQTDMDKLRMVVDEADRKEFDKVVNLLMGCSHLYILGVRSSYFVAGYLNFYMHLLSENVTLVQSNAAGEIFEQLFRIGPGDVLLAISFPRYSNVTVNTVKFARDRGATIVPITDNELSPVYQMSDAALLAPSEMISFVGLHGGAAVADQRAVGGHRLPDGEGCLQDLWRAGGYLERVRRIRKDGR